jgi:antirestriction protein ArdC
VTERNIYKEITEQIITELNTGVRLYRSYAPYAPGLNISPQASNPDQRDVVIDEFIAATGAKIWERELETEASYLCSIDCINLPSFRCFRSSAEYYAATFHELIHWAGHRSRLNRQLGGQFESRSGAFEELIAELGAAFLCAEFSISKIPHAAYIKACLLVLQNDPRALPAAAAKAQAAVDFLHQKIRAAAAPHHPKTTTLSEDMIMYDSQRHDGGVSIYTDDGADMLVVEPTVAAFRPVQNNLRCICGASLRSWSWHCRATDDVELTCSQCHRVLAHFQLETRVYL